MGTLLLVALAAFLRISPAQETPPSPELVARTVTELTTALTKGDKDEKTRALQAASRVNAPEVIKLVARGFKDDENEVKAATIQALRFLDHEDALALLHRALASDRAIKKDEALTASLIKAIGQHADPSSVRVLSKDAFETKNYAAIRARVLGFGKIRTRESLEALLDLMKVTGQHTIDRYMGDFRLSLMVLTGTDRGPSSAQWQRWWQDHKKTFEVAPEPALLPRPQALQWANFWGNEEGYGRVEKREERGNDPERRRRTRDRD